MQIQRIQSLYLLIAAVFTGLFCFFPYAVLTISENETTAVQVSDTPVLFILNITITILLALTIFKFRNLRSQISLTLLDFWLIIGSIITTLIYIFFGHDAAAPAYNGGVIMLVLAAGFTVAAYSRMKHDQRLLSSADRLR